MNEFKNLIQKLSEHTGLSLEVNESESVYLEYDDFIITLQYRSIQNDIVIYTPVIDPDKVANISESILKRALSLAYNGEGTMGCFLGLFEENLILSRILPMKDLTPNIFAGHILQFTNAAISVHNSLVTASHKEYKINSVQSDDVIINFQSGLRV